MIAATAVVELARSNGECACQPREGEGQPAPACTRDPQCACRLRATPFRVFGCDHSSACDCKHGSRVMRVSVLERFEQRAPASVMARVALEYAVPSEWIDAVFEEHRQRQYSRELLFSTVIELVTLVSL